MAQMVKNLPAMQETGFNPWVGKIPWRREWQPTPAFLPGESQGQRSLVGSVHEVTKELDTTEQLTLSLCHLLACKVISVTVPRFPLSAGKTTEEIRRLIM